MIKLIFAIYDSKAESYGPQLMLFSAVGEAIRSWDDVVNDDKSQFNRHPGDYTLMELGTYDMNTGEIRLLEAKKSHGTGLDYKREALDTTFPYGKNVQGKKFSESHNS